VAGVGGVDAPSLLKTALAQGRLQVIGADTLDESHRFVEQDKALERRFHPILVREPIVADTIAILQWVVPRYEKHHQIHYSPQALEAAANLSERYLADRKLPDKAEAERNVQKRLGEPGSRHWSVRLDRCDAGRCCTDPARS